uniref:UbiD family decarboxylase domain-containing protein n=1 Tax=Polymorphobacter sp. TaxID=1909290 RepID=UPI003F708EC9
ITALQHGLDAAGRYPVVRIDRPVLADGSVSDFPLVCNLTASRALVADMLSLADHREAAMALASAARGGIEPIRVPRAQAAIAQVELTDRADMTRLPATTQHRLDPGPYLTAAHATTYDPESRIDNTAIQRCWIKGARRMSWYPYPASHNAINLRKFWARGEPCPVAFWIGHHPAVVIGTQAKLAYPRTHWDAAGGLAAEAIALTPSLTLGPEIMVPADAEIVIEGWAHPGQLEADGPFGEFTGYLGPQVMAPVVEVSAITHRRGAIYHDYGSGLADMLVPDNMAMEGKLFGLIRQIAPSLRNVHVPSSGRRLHAWLQLEDPGPGEARDALAAAMAYRRLKTVAAFDMDVDVFDESRVMWGLATRVQWDRDVLRVDGLSTSTLDPSLAAGARTASKLGIDATLPARAGAGLPRPCPPVAESPAEAVAAAAAILQGRAMEAWPCQ